MPDLIVYRNEFSLFIFGKNGTKDRWVKIEKKKGQKYL